MNIAIEKYQPINQAGLLGKVSLRLADGPILHDVKLMREADLFRVIPPANIRTANGSAVQLDDQGRPLRTRILSFTTPEASRAWRRAVLDLVLRECADLLPVDATARAVAA